MAFFSCVLMVEQRGICAIRACGSTEIAGFQSGIGLIDDLQLLLGRLVPAMRVGMVQLDQCLVPRLQTHRGERRLDLEYGKRLFLSRERSPHRLALRPLAISPGSSAAPGKNAEGVAHPSRVTGAMTVPEPPSRPLPHSV